MKSVNLMDSDDDEDPNDDFKPNTDLKLDIDRYVTFYWKSTLTYPIL